MAEETSFFEVLIEGLIGENTSTVRQLCVPPTMPVKSCFEVGLNEQTTTSPRAHSTGMIVLALLLVVVPAVVRAQIVPVGTHVNIMDFQSNVFDLANFATLPLTPVQGLNKGIADTAQQVCIQSLVFHPVLLFIKSTVGRGSSNQFRVLSSQSSIHRCLQPSPIRRPSMVGIPSAPRYVEVLLRQRSGTSLSPRTNLVSRPSTVLAHHLPFPDSRLTI